MQESNVAFAQYLQAYTAASVQLLRRWPTFVPDVRRGERFADTLEPEALKNVRIGRNEKLLNSSHGPTLLIIATIQPAPVPFLHLLRWRPDRRHLGRGRRCLSPLGRPRWTAC